MKVMKASDEEFKYSTVLKYVFGIGAVVGLATYAIKSVSEFDTEIFAYTVAAIGSCALFYFAQSQWFYKLLGAKFNEDGDPNIRPTDIVLLGLALLMILCGLMLHQQIAAGFGAIFIVSWIIFRMRGH